jgi:tetratricopeptide (TPR) repeat protein
MIKNILPLLVALFPLSATAQNAVVRGGEHGDFTRLTVSMDQPTEWSVNSENDEITVELGEGYDFNLNFAYARIGTERINNIQRHSDGSSIGIKLNCDCDYKYYKHNDLIVVDILDGSSDGFPVKQEVDKYPTSDTINKNKERMNLVSGFTKPRIGVFSGLGPSTLNAPSSQVLFPSQFINPAINVSQNYIHKEKKPENISNVSENLSRGLARAATQGLLQPSNESDLSAPYERTTVDLKNTQQVAHQSERQQIRSMISQDLKAEADQYFNSDRLSIGADGCIQDSELKISDWASGDDDIGSLISSVRSEIVGEFDSVNLEALEQRIRQLAYLGFGAEMRYSMALSRELDNPVLLALSFLLDNADDPKDFFKNQLHCDGNVVLWAVLEADEDTSADEVDMPALMRSFEILPRHLKEHIGPELSEKLSNLGRTSAAKEILRRLERTAGGKTDSIELGRAKIELREGNVDKAEINLGDLAVTPGREALEALKTAIDLANMKGDAVPSEIVDLSEAYSIEYRNTELGRDIWMSHMQALCLNKEYERAIDFIRMSDGIPVEMINSVKSDLLHHLSKVEEDEYFLNNVFKVALSDVAMIDVDSVLLVSQRLLDIGLPDAAISYVDQLPVSPPLREIQVFRAKALLASGQPNEAEMILIGRQGDDIDSLRAEARRQMGDHDFVREAYSNLGRFEEADNSAWISGAWEDVGSAGGGTLSEAAGLMRSEQTEIDYNSISLESARSIFEISAKSRETLRELLINTDF